MSPPVVFLRPAGTAVLGSHEPSLRTHTYGGQIDHKVKALDGPAY